MPDLVGLRPAGAGGTLPGGAALGVGELGLAGLSAPAALAEAVGLLGVGGERGHQDGAEVGVLAGGAGSGAPEDRPRHAMQAEVHRSVGSLVGVDGLVDPHPRHQARVGEDRITGRPVEPF